MRILGKNKTKNNENTLFKKKQQWEHVKNKTIRTLCTIRQWWHFVKKKKKNANTFSTIYEFNTSSDFRGFMYILNYFEASNTCTSF